MNRHIRHLAKALLSHFPKLTRAYRNVRDNWPVDDELRPTALGFRFAGHDAMVKGEFEPDETRLVTAIVSSGAVDVVVNVGANIGYYCCLALSLGKEVIAFEPLNRNLQYLFRNIMANEWQTRVEIFPIALANVVGVVEIYGGGTGASMVKGWAGTPEQYVSLVPCSTMDRVLARKLENTRCFVLVDVEGAEQSLLEGAPAILAMRPKPIWLVEISISEHQPKGLAINPNLLSTFQLFWDNGYEARTADTECRVIEPTELKEVVTSGIDTLGTHNFLFIDGAQACEMALAQRNGSLVGPSSRTING